MNTERNIEQERYDVCMTTATLLSALAARLPSDFATRADEISASLQVIADELDPHSRGNFRRIRLVIACEPEDFAEYLADACAALALVERLFARLYRSDDPGRARLARDFDDARDRADQLMLGVDSWACSLNESE